MEMLIIAAEFLELARKERQLGNRTLLDVLTGEAALINANSAAASASALPPTPCCRCSAPGSLDTGLSHAAGLIEIAACHA